MPEMQSSGLPTNFLMSRLASLVWRCLPLAACMQAAPLSAGDVIVRDDASLVAALARLPA